MPTRRTFLALPALLALPARAEEAARQPPALAMPHPVRLRPGRAPVMLDARIGEGGQAPLLLRFSGKGAPAATFRFTSWYGNARAFALLPLRGREVVLVAFEGNTGTGVYQEIQAVIGEDDDGVARILALETLRARETAVCDDASFLTIRITPVLEGGGLRLDHFARGTFGTCGPPSRRPRPFRSEWGTTLRWSGRGPLSVPPADRRAGPERWLVEAARMKAATWLAEAPRTEVTIEDVDRLGLMDVLRKA